MFMAEEGMFSLGRLVGALGTSPAVHEAEEEKKPYGTVGAIDCLNSTPLALKFFEILTKYPPNFDRIFLEERL